MSSNTSMENPKLNLFCAVYRPKEGNYYHMALAAQYMEQWDIWEIAREDDNLPFQRKHLKKSPLASRRCLRPLTALASVRPDNLSSIIAAVNSVPVPHKDSPDNCQDYVLNIWEELLAKRVLTQEQYDAGYQAMQPFIGPNFGDSSGESQESRQDEPDHRQDGPRGPLSAEFIVDSSDSSQ